jgi:hypothetical protein
LEVGSPDALYTINSTIYGAAFAAVWDANGSMYDFVDKMLREIPHYRVQADDFMTSLAFGWKDAENMLKVEFAKILEPQPRRANLLAELDVGVVIKEWFSTFDEYLIEDEDEEKADSDSEGDEGDVEFDSGSEEDEKDMPCDLDSDSGEDEAPPKSHSDGYEDKMSSDLLKVLTSL